MKKKLNELQITKLLLVFLFLVGFLVNFGNLKNQMFWDDKAFIFDNPYVQNISLDNIKTIFTTDILQGSRETRRRESESNYYRPLLLLSFMANYLTHGESVVGYHLVNNFIHVANGLLFFFLLSLLFKNKALAFFSALVFLINPIQTEGVTYVSGRGDLMATFFMLIPLVLLSKYTEKKWFLPLTISMQILALLSREIGVVFPGLFILTNTIRFKELGFVDSFTKSLKKSIPYIVIVFTYVILRLTVLNFGSTLNFHPGANIYYDSISVRLFTFLPVIRDYLSLIFYPRDLHVRFEGSFYTSLFDIPVLTSLVMLFSFGFILLRLYKQKSNDFYIWLFGLGWFFVNLTPTSGIVAIIATMQEHWVYSAMVGPVFIAVYYLHKTYILFVTRRFFPAIGIFWVVALLYFYYLFWYTGVRNHIWSDPLTFFEDYRSYEVGNARILNNLGTYYSTIRNDHVKAEESYRKAISFDPDFAEPYYNLGNLLGQGSKIEEGVFMLKKAIEVEPEYPKPYEVLAYYYESKNDLAGAIANWKMLEKLTPNDEVVYYNLGILSYKVGDKKSARLYLEEVVSRGKSEKLSVLAKKLLSELAKLEN